jgi:hypothetical protein
VLVVGRVEIVEKEGCVAVVFWGALASTMDTLGRGRRVVLEEDVTELSTVEVSIVVCVLKTRLVVVISWSSAPSDVEIMSAASTFCVGLVLIAVVREGTTSFELSAIQN